MEFRMILAKIKKGKDKHLNSAIYKIKCAFKVNSWYKSKLLIKMVSKLKCLNLIVYSTPSNHLLQGTEFDQVWR